MSDIIPPYLAAVGATIRRGTYLKVGGALAGLAVGFEEGWVSASAIGLASAGAFFYMGGVTGEGMDNMISWFREEPYTFVRFRQPTRVKIASAFILAASTLPLFPHTWTDGVKNAFTFKWALPMSPQGSATTPRGPEAPNTTSKVSTPEAPAKASDWLPKPPPPSAEKPVAPPPANTATPYSDWLPKPPEAATAENGGADKECLLHLDKTINGPDKSLWAVSYAELGLPFVKRSPDGQYTLFKIIEGPHRNQEVWVGKAAFTTKPPQC